MIQTEQFLILKLEMRKCKTMLKGWDHRVKNIGDDDEEEDGEKCAMEKPHL